MRLCTELEEMRTSITTIAKRHGFSADAARTMLDAIAAGDGSMAQFDHREFGGAGQWMRGGMLMIGDMFNDALKARVAALCADLSQALANDPGLAPARAKPDRWWPASLGNPASTGAQNDARYAYFPERRRLAIDVGGAVSVYDTLDHRIMGFGQQQGARGSMAFTSQKGSVDVATLPLAGSDDLD